jgi:Na+-transporting NADH:ubiquinone oxidoreductase subunit A
MAIEIRIRKGLDLPISGEPRQEIGDGPQVRTVAIVADDFVGMKPTMEVSEGDSVQLGQLLFTDKKTPGVQYVSPACGKVQSIYRGAKRKFESIVIELDGDEQVTFESIADRNLAQLDRRQVRDHLIASGLWTSLRVRPFGKVPDPNSVPDALFITAIDTNPLAADPAVVLAAGQERNFVAGIQALSTLSDGTTYLCKKTGATIPGMDQSCVTVAEFSGPHPAGLPGTHIHFLNAVSDSRTAWYVNYQDVAAIGHLFLTGQLSVDRVVALAGPAAVNPRLVRTRIGASLADLTEQEKNTRMKGDVRVVSGSVLSGRASLPPRDYLGRFHLQVSLLEEGHRREFLGWLMPGTEKFSVKRAFSSAVAGSEDTRYAMTTSTEGSPRAIVPIGSYEQVMPLDMMATALLKALVTDDVEYAQALGCLELDEEDLGLCTYVCPGKIEYGPVLRKVLTRIELEG